MVNLPFDIPKSLTSYVEQFQDDPLKVTTRLKNQLEKRGPDAVGYFLLAWFYHLKGMNDQALEQALKAKIFAPGSPFLDKLHYYFSHPDKFDAWEPADFHKAGREKDLYREKQPGPVLEDLDSLIQQLSDVEKITIPENEFSKGSDDLDKRLNNDVDDIVSETLAGIHEKQGKTDAAIRTYKRLKKLNREKREYYTEKISQLEQKKQEQENDTTGH